MKLAIEDQSYIIPAMIKRLVKLIKLFIPLAVILLGIFATIYGTVQHNYRTLANDPQIQIAQDLARELENGQKAEPLNASAKVDPSKSLASFVIVFDKQGNPVASTANLNGRIPMPPKGVFESAETQGENRVTWQPNENTRIAAVIVPFHGANPGYVLAGRSLKEVEMREEYLQWQVLGGLIGSLIVCLGALFIFVKANGK